ncbi:MAG: alpha-glucan family phosphorylase [Anaerolineae bacterium]|nr:alpha-glucan family phosphorylase [Anaerolineae bacterium]
MKPIATYKVVSSMPEALSRLPELAYNIRWAWDHETINLFRRLGGELWEESNHNPVKMLGLLSQSKLDALSRDDGFLAHLERVLNNYDAYVQSGHKAWYAQEFGFEEQPQIAYFSFEFGLTESIPNYSGGLGVLAGDHLKAASDLNVPLVGVGLLYQQGYFRQYLNIDGWQQEMYPENDFYTMPIRLVTGNDGQPITINIELPDHPVYAQIWRVEVGRIDLYLLDTNIPQNKAREDQDLTDQLYGGNREMRIKQEILLGIGGLRALYALGIEPAACHMNEGHSAFLSLERARVLMNRLNITFPEALAITTSSNIFTTHTPVPAGNDYFVPELIEKYFKTYRTELGLSREEFLALGRFAPGNVSESFCMTILALRTSNYTNGVSRLHGEVAREMWQDVYPSVPLREVPIDSITNGVHSFSWVSADMGMLFDRYLGPRWREAPTDQRVWQRAANIPDEELWRTHERRRARLVAFARRRLVEQLQKRGAPPAEIDAAHEALDPDVLTIGFARRFATYKRATLLLLDPERFLALLQSDRPVQFIFAGKAHPHDNEGKEFIRQIVHFARTSGSRNRVVFLEDYDMIVARYLVQGADVWLNTPRRPFEASGTSGMKAALNAVLSLSVLDGWWAEAYQRHLGWAIGAGETYDNEELQDYVESNAVYDLLEKDIIPTFYNRGSDDLPRGWIMLMKNCLRELGPIYNTARMVQEYCRRYYFAAVENFRSLAENEYEKGLSYADWLINLRSHWNELQIGDIEATIGSEIRVGDLLEVRASIHLGDISPEDVSVQLYEGILDRQGEIERGRAAEMELESDVKSKDGWSQYRVEFVTEATGRHGYTIRILPRHPEMRRVMHLGLITWAE